MKTNRRTFLQAATLPSLAALLPVLPAGAQFPVPPGAAPGKIPFPVGETLVYNVYWGILHVGSSVFTSEWVEEDGKRFIHIRMRTQSNNVLAQIYPVDDFLDTWIDPETFVPIRYRKNQSQGRHRRNELTTFDRAGLTATWRSLLKKKIKTYAIRESTRDLLSFMYFMRAHDIQEGAVTKFEVMADEKLYNLDVHADKIETVDLKQYGPTPSLKIEPKAEFKGLMVTKGRMKIWVSRDDRRIATKVELETPFANVKVLLHEVKGPGEDKWIRTPGASLPKPSKRKGPQGRS